MSSPTSAAAAESVPVPDTHRTLGSLLRAPYRRLQRRLYEELARSGFGEIRAAHSAVFRHLAPEGSRLVDLAERAEMTKQSMAYLVGCLSDHGYVKVQPDVADGRAKRVVLTAKGRRFVAAALAASERIEREVAAKLGAAAVADLRRLLEDVDGALAPED
jgi:DNA-binding MarR family transcriptional regulator